MAKVKIKWDISGFEDVRRSPEVMDLIGAKADEIAEICNGVIGAGYVSTVSQGRTRGRASVYTYSAEAMIDNRRNNTILRALAQTTGMLVYTTKAGKTRFASQAQIDNWTKAKR